MLFTQDMSHRSSILSQNTNKNAFLKNVRVFISVLIYVIGQRGEHIRGTSISSSSQRSTSTWTSTRWTASSTGPWPTGSWWMVISEMYIIRMATHCWYQICSIQFCESPLVNLKLQHEKTFPQFIFIAFLLTGGTLTFLDHMDILSKLPHTLLASNWRSI